MGLQIIIKLLIGFAIFFGGVVFNVRIMSRKNPSPLMARLSMAVISAGLIVLVIMANSIDLGTLEQKAPPDEPAGEVSAQQWF